MEIINEKREEMQKKRTYEQYSPKGCDKQMVKNRLDRSLSPKLKELAQIFKDNGVEMDWEEIVEETVEEVMEKYGIFDAEVKDFMSGSTGHQEDNVRVEVQKSIIKKLEFYDVMQ